MAPTIHAPGTLPKEDGANMPEAGLIPTSCQHGAKCTHAQSGSAAQEPPQERGGTAGTTHDRGLNPTAHTPEQFRVNSDRKMWEQHWRAREQGLSENTPISQLCLMATEGEKRGQKVEIGRKRVGKQKGENEGCQRDPCKHSLAVHSPRSTLPEGPQGD